MIEISQKYFPFLDADIGSLVTVITANDVDTGPPLTYSFTLNGNPGGFFTIDTFSGRLALAKKLDYETQKEYLLTIEVGSVSGVRKN